MSGKLPSNGTLHHVEICVSDLSKATDFWKWLLTEKFSYTVFQQWDSGISFLLGETYIVFVQTERNYLGNAYNRKNTGLNHLAFHCNSRKFVDELTKELKARNITVLYKDRHPFAGGEENPMQLKYLAKFDPIVKKLEHITNQTNDKRRQNPRKNLGN